MEGNAGIVFIVEDDAPVRESTAALLETYGWTVRRYGTAQELLDDIAGASMGCLLLDQNLPDIDGVELLMMLRQRDIQLPAIIMTGRGEAGLERRARVAGVFATLHKPVDGEELNAWIGKALASVR